MVDNAWRPIRTKASLELALGTNDEDSHKAEFTLESALEAQLTRNLEFRSIVRLRSEVFDELDPGDPVQEELSPVSRSLLIGVRSDLA